MEKAIKKILVYYDEGETAPYAVNAAVGISKAFGADMSLLFMQSENKEETDALRKKVDSIIAEKRLRDNIKIECIMKEGKMTKEVTETADAIQANCVVLGTSVAASKNSFLPFMSATSDTYKVVSSAHCPVITIQKELPLRNIKDIIVPIDKSEDTRQKIPWAILIAGQLGATVHVVGINSSNLTGEWLRKLEAYSRQSRDYIEQHKIKTTLTMLKGKDDIEMLIEHAKKINAGMIFAIAKEDEGSFFGSTVGIENLIHQSPVPIMCVQPKDMKISWTGM